MAGETSKVNRGGGIVDFAVRELFERAWWTIALRGLAGVLAGIVAVSWPHATLRGLFIVLGVYFVVDGVLALGAGFRATRAERRAWPYVVEGIVSLAVGVLAFAHPTAVALAVLVLIALRCLVTGFVQIATGIRFRRTTGRSEWLLWAAGLISIGFGLLILTRPGSGALTLVWLIGAYTILFGILEITVGFRLKGFADRRLVGQAP